MKVVGTLVLGAGATLLAGCVQQASLPPPPIQLQPMGPAIPYRSIPTYREPMLAPAATPTPDLAPLAPAPLPAPAADDNGAIPLQDMPPPASDNQPPSSPAKPADAAPGAASEAAPAPVVQRPPTSGPGSNVPLEGFRPMRGQTRPAL